MKPQPARSRQPIAAHAGSRNSEITSALLASRRALIGLGLMSGLVNVLYLTGSFFMLEVYDRVIPSRSIPTLVGLCLLALTLYAFQGGLEVLRARALVRIGAMLDESLGGRVFDTVIRAPLVGRMPGDGLLPLRDLDTLRSFLSGPAPGALFDLPWMPLYLLICFLFHPLIGLAALLGGGVLVTLTVVTDRLTRSPAQTATGYAASRSGLAEAGQRNAEVLAAMGMREIFAQRWLQASRGYLEAQQRVADIGGGLGAVSKVFRLALQSGVLALGAYLVIGGQASSGIIIASSILVSRALAPAELAIANWRGFVAARQSWHRLDLLLSTLPAVPEPHELPAPSRSVSLRAISVAPPQIQRLILQDVSLELEAGTSLGIVGPSASGKSSLVRAIVGVWTPLRGTVRLDGASLDQWSSSALGRHIGYLPQEVELFEGTIAENIARFDPEASPGAVIEAAQAAGFHEAIVQMPGGYDCPIGERGTLLSAGQRQRVGLARALYRNPFLVVLDEPNANLDVAGESALAAALHGVRARGGISIVVAHRPNVLATVDRILALADGRVAEFGPKDEVLRRLLRPTAVPVSSAAPPSTPAAAQASFLNSVQRPAFGASANRQVSA
ncbi:type I secretion system permease/ATPase [Methylobacterium organophilum]|uniref:Type I secretion system ATP-binding protein PrsD n=1 Tax=Methylobacterium organophilum TaxID=410 RepID=A0ABQ4TCL6_METOR|nr:type I secretion system permease/ATPase [Methylobacterium organophilum]GJE29446.1 Type I secretion system ATP-binding protein PrsD [Methylobacterium organophilum]